MYELYNSKGEFKFYRIQRIYTDENGIKCKRIFRSKKSVTECKQLFRKELRIVVRAKKEKLTFRYFAANYYYTHIQHAELSKSYKQTYCNVIFNYLIPKFGDYNVTDITHNECQVYLNSLIGYSRSHIISIKKVLRRLFKVAIREDIIKFNLTDDLVLPFCIEHERRAITDDERRLLYQVCESHPSGAMALTMLLSGLRPMEIQNMTWDWIDFENNILTVGKSKTKAGTGRKIPIPTELSTMLKELKLKGYNDEYVFVKYNNHCEMDGNSFYQSWRNFLREVEIAHGAEVYRNQIVKHVLAPDLEPYLLRHTFCTDCQAAGVPLNVAKELMGHSDISVTAKIYTHMVDEVFEQNRKRLTEYANQKEQQTQLA